MSRYSSAVVALVAFRHGTREIQPGDQFAPDLWDVDEWTMRAWMEGGLIGFGRAKRSAEDLAAAWGLIEAAPTAAADPAAEEEAGEEGGDDGTEEPAAVFVFDPEVHTVKHRGSGRYVVLAGEEVVYGPAPKAEIDALMQAAPTAAADPAAEGEGK